MLLKGEKVFVVTRRLFEKDLRRHFVGEVREVSGGAVRVQGYMFLFDESRNEFVRRDDLRTQIFSLIDATLVINVLPTDVVLEAIRYRVDQSNHLVLTDGKSFKMDVNEFGVYL